MDIVSWARETKGGKKEEHFRKMFRRAGCPVDEIEDPFYLDRPLVKQPPRLDIEHMPELQQAVHSVVDGGQLVVASLGQFGVSRVWAWVAQYMTRKGASVRDLETGRVFDFAVDPAVGYEGERLVEKLSNRLRTEKARAARIESGRLGPREVLKDEAKRRRAKKLWEDSNLSAAEVAHQTGVSVPTLYRHLGPKTQAEAAAKAKK